MLFLFERAIDSTPIPIPTPTPRAQRIRPALRGRPKPRLLGVVDYFLSRNWQVTSKNQLSSLDLDLDLDVDVDGLVRGKFSRHNIYKTALILWMLTSKSKSKSRSRNQG